MAVWQAKCQRVWSERQMDVCPVQVEAPLVAEAPSLGSGPIQVNRAKLVLGNYPPTPDDVAAKSLIADPPPSPPASKPKNVPSVVQYFRCAMSLCIKFMLPSWPSFQAGSTPES